MELWKESDKKIIQDHCKDFNVSNYKTKVPNLKGYLTDLGGIFEQGLPLIEKKCTTLSGFRLMIQFTFGVLNIFGPDYSNGDNEKTSHYYRWGCGSGSKAAADAFRTSGRGKCKGGTLFGILDPTIVTTNCNSGIDTLLRNLGWYKTSCTNIKTWAKTYGKTVAKKKDLKRGDIVHFFSKSLDRSKPDTWKGWVHVAMVYEVKDGKVWLIDFGSRYIKSKNPLHYMPVNDSPQAGGEYGTRYWTAIHAFDLKEDTVKEKTIEDLSVEMKKAIDGHMDALRKEYGEEVAQMVEEYTVDREAYLRAAANYVLDGYAGSGEARKVFFGNDYDAVQGKVNWVMEAAQDTIAGRYGSGEIRKKALGKDYYVVQKQVNRILGE